MKNLAALNIRLENNLEIARTSRDTGKTPSINYLIGNNKERKIFEKKQESPEHIGKLDHVLNHRDVRKSCELQIYLQMRRKKGIFLKTV